MISTNYKKSMLAKKKANENKNNLPLSNDISGMYSYNPIKQEFRNNKRQNTEFKQIHSIRLGEVSNNLFINHKDYSVVKTTYISTQTAYDYTILNFDYNNQSYSFKYNANETNYYKLIKL